MHRGGHAGPRGDLDFMNDVAVWYARRVIIRILDVAEELDQMMLTIT